MTRVSIGTWGASALAAVLALGAPQARAQQQGSDEAMQGGMTEERDLADEQARLHFRAGRGLYDAGRFRQAAEEFDEAYRLSRRPELLFNAYVAHRDANDLEGAVRNLAAYLEQVADAPDRVNLQARLQSMQEALEQQRARDAAIAESRAREAPSTSARGPEVWPWIVAALGGAALVGGAVTGGLALSEADALVQDCGSIECDGSIDLEGRRSTVQTLGITTDVLLFAGGAIALTGIILGAVLSGGGGESTPEVGAACDSTGCAASLRGRF